MNQKLIVTAVGAALAAAAGSAFAALPSTQVNGVTAVPSNIVYMSGATAQNGGIDNVVRLNCEDGTLDAYTVASGQVVYVCKVKAGSTLDRTNTAAGTSIAIHKDSVGGSSNGIGPVNSCTTLNFVNLTGISATPGDCATTASVSGSGSLAGKVSWLCSTATTGVVPDIGFSDVDPPLFGLSATGLSLFGPNQVTFGVAVTKPLYAALQAKQFGTACPIISAASGSVPMVTTDTAACTPSLSSAQVQRLFQSAKINTGTILGLTGGDAGTRIYPLRRGSTSGTQLTAEVFFFNNANQGAGGANGLVKSPQFTVNTFIAPDPAYNSKLASEGYIAGTSAGGCGDATLVPDANIVFAGSANEQVVNCLNRHGIGGRFAVANLTMELNQFNAAQASTSTAIDTNFMTNFRFVKLNGYLPTAENVIKGNYEYFSEQVIAVKTGTTLTSTTPKGNVLNAMVSDLGNRENLALINSGLTAWTDLSAGSQYAGLVGAPKSATCPVAFAGTTNADTDPVNYLTKNPTGTKVSNAVKPAVAICPPRY